MKITNLERATDYDVRDWLVKELDLTQYQKRKLFDDETIRFSPFYFYKQKQKPKVNLLWRITLLLVPIYLLALFIFLPIKFLFTGKWGYGRNFVDKFHSKWFHKLNL